MTEREAWKVAYQKWADADPCENGDAFVFRQGYAAAIRDVLKLLARLDWETPNAGALANRRRGRRAAALMPKDAP